eukprot:TRINITY_DN95018_c0_g1_i1.p1 TRINITY_DN95018_c0_g1~~TRINITY_DN95018_c0_g1_i1.p1  ORF type:complete len:337 (+),score=75.76 TRINITY_DN95018_c0_g1_i1:92-1102(+)
MRAVLNPAGVPPARVGYPADYGSPAAAAPPRGGFEYTPPAQPGFGTYEGYASATQAAHRSGQDSQGQPPPPAHYGPPPAPSYPEAAPPPAQHYADPQHSQYGYYGSPPPPQYAHLPIPPPPPRKRRPGPAEDDEDGEAGRWPMRRRVGGKGSSKGEGDDHDGRRGKLGGKLGRFATSVAQRGGKKGVWTSKLAPGLLGKTKKAKASKAAADAGKLVPQSKLDTKSLDDQLDKYMNRKDAAGDKVARAKAKLAKLVWPPWAVRKPTVGYGTVEGKPVLSSKEISDAQLSQYMAAPSLPEGTKKTLANSRVMAKKIWDAPPAETKTETPSGEKPATDK